MPRKKKYRLLYCGDCKQEFLSISLTQGIIARYAGIG